MEVPTAFKKLSFNAGVLLTLAVLGFLVYANTLPNKMFWDDDDFILKNRYVQDWNYFPKLFSENMIAGAGLISNYWRPALATVFAVEWHLWGAWAPGFHLVNFIFHLINAGLLFYLLRRLFKNRWLAFFTALIFLLHPLQTEAVSYVNSLGDSLSVFFIFFGLNLFCGWRESGRPAHDSAPYFASLFMFILALLSKETAVIMPGLIFLVDFFRETQAPLAARLKRAAAAVWPFLFLLGFYVLLRATVLNFQNTFNLYNEQNIFTGNLYVRLITFCKVLAIYFGLLFWPVGLHMERTMEVGFVNNFWQSGVIIGALLSAGLLFLAVWQYKKRPAVSFGVLWFFIGLSITSNLVVPVSGILYEHWLYLPLVGIFVGLLALGLELTAKFGRKKTALSVFVLFLIFLGGLTIYRNRQWRDPITFYNQTLAYAPQSYRVINNLGMAYADAGDGPRAEKTYRRAIELDPKNPVAYHNLANTYADEGRETEAAQNFAKALSLDPKFLFSYNSWAQMYLQAGKYREAREVLEKSLDYSADKVGLLVTLSRIAYQEKDIVSAERYLNMILVLEPGNTQVQAAIFELKTLTTTPQ